MATFQYEAKDKNNEVVRGTLETNNLGEAMQALSKQGLTLRKMNQVADQVAGMKQSVLDVLPQEASHEVNIAKPVQQEEEDRIQVPIQPEREEQPVQEASAQIDLISPLPGGKKQDRASIIADQRKQVSIKGNEEAEEKDSIIFARKPKSLPRKLVVDNDDILSVQDDIQVLLKGKGLSPHTKGQLEHLEGVLEELQDSQNKKRWKNFQKRFKKVKKTAERELEHFEDQQWKDLEDAGKRVESYTEFDEADKSPKRKIAKLVKEPSRLSKWLRIVDQPIETDEKEVLIKQHYESAWAEVQRFSGALLGFYLVVYISSYYLKRNGIDDNFLVRIYNTTLFKQLVYGLFSLFVLSTIRQTLPRKKVNSDALFVIAWVILLGAVYL